MRMIAVDKDNNTIVFNSIKECKDFIADIINYYDRYKLNAKQYKIYRYNYKNEKVLWYYLNVDHLESPFKNPFTW